LLLTVQEISWNDSSPKYAIMCQAWHKTLLAQRCSLCVFFLVGIWLTQQQAETACSWGRKTAGPDSRTQGGRNPLCRGCVPVDPTWKQCPHFRRHIRQHALLSITCHLPNHSQETVSLLPYFCSTIYKASYKTRVYMP